MRVTIELSEKERARLLAYVELRAILAVAGTAGVSIADVLAKRLYNAAVDAREDE